MDKAIFNISSLKSYPISLGPIITKGFLAKLNWSFFRGSMIGFFSDMRDAHVYNHLESGERSFYSSSVKIELVPIDF